MRPLAISVRWSIVSSVLLAIALGVAAYALDRAFLHSQVEAMELRLRGYFYSFLQGADITVGGRLILPEVLPEGRFDRPGSGLYAAVRGDDFEWRSPSALGRELPFDDRLRPGEFVFEGPLPSSVGGVYLYRAGVSFGEQKPRQFTFFIAEHEASLRRQRHAFREELWRWLGGLGLLLLVLQFALIRWSLGPLRTVARDLAAVERGQCERLAGPYPAELAALTSHLNAFIQNERETLVRYRNTLGDLAHSLKTPLAVMRGLIDAEQTPGELRHQALEQLKRMDEIVAYQLARAAASGHRTFSAPLAVDQLAEDLVRSLEKVYADKGVLCEFELDDKARFHGERGDLSEVLGNLLDNAFKWARTRVLLSSRSLGGPRARRPGIELMVEDDGPGVPEHLLTRIGERGLRADERVHGHGIGLSIVREIAASYGGVLEVGRSTELGGARFVFRIPPLAPEAR